MTLPPDLTDDVCDAFLQAACAEASYAAEALCVDAGRVGARRARRGVLLDPPRGLQEGVAHVVGEVRRQRHDEIS